MLDFKDKDFVDFLRYALQQEIEIHHNECVDISRLREMTPEECYIHLRDGYGWSDEGLLQLFKEMI